MRNLRSCPRSPLFDRTCCCKCALLPLRSRQQSRMGHPNLLSHLVGQCQVQTRAILHRPPQQAHCLRCCRFSSIWNLSRYVPDWWSKPYASDYELYGCDQYDCVGWLSVVLFHWCEEMVQGTEDHIEFGWAYWRSNSSSQGGRIGGRGLEWKRRDGWWDEGKDWEDGLNSCWWLSDRNRSLRLSLNAAGTR